MRPFLLSPAAGVLVLSLASSQVSLGSGENTGLPQIPFGQTYKDFQFPLYQNGQLSATLSAVSAQGMTINRAQATDLKIDLYTNGKVTTTITSPKADLYIADRIMRTKNTVQIERVDMEATAQSCDFDLGTKKYQLRDHVKVTLKNFDTSITPKTSRPSATSPSTPLSDLPGAPAPETPPVPNPDSDRPHGGDSLLDIPGAYGTTNTAPIQPTPAP